MHFCDLYKIYFIPLHGINIKNGLHKARQTYKTQKILILPRATYVTPTSLLLCFQFSEGAGNFHLFRECMKIITQLSHTLCTKMQKTNNILVRG